MKKHLLLFGAIVWAVMGMTLTSCGDDNDKDEPSKLSSLEWADYDDGEICLLLKFNSDHTGSFWIYEGEQNGKKNNFTWSVKDEILTFKFDNNYGYGLFFESGDFYFLNDKLYLPDADMGKGIHFTRLK